MRRETFVVLFLSGRPIEATRVEFCRFGGANTKPPTVSATSSGVGAVKMMNFIIGSRIKALT